MQILAAETSRTMPWKNGLGSTLELATDAPRADDTWSWRLSIADVPSRAACSTFVGISRVLLVLDGDGLLLERAHGTDAVPMIGSGLRFEGEESIVCAPIGSCVRDVNLMFDRSRWDGVLRLVLPRRTQPRRDAVFPRRPRCGAQAVGTPHPDAPARSTAGLTERQAQGGQRRIPKWHEKRTPWQPPPDRTKPAP